jgi:hypothetical protein
MQLHEKAEQGREQSEPEMEEPDTDASAVDSSADAQPGRNAVRNGREPVARTSGSSRRARRL